MTANVDTSVSIDGEPVARTAIRVFRDDLGAVQAEADRIVAEELGAAEGEHIGPELLYRLEHTALLHLLVGARMLARVEQVEAEGALVEDRSSGWLRRRAPLRRWYERLRTLAFGESDREGRPRVRCRCVCGEYSAPLADDVRHGLTRSCGCLRDELTADRNRERAARRAA
ncbi:hypothetical protein [Sorangium sp. So ce233]|uniref:hypothetical protein n=1 Tax=Sorangium sp. So ce233 TaxID=3133290 RepID=UPI003F627CB9